MHALYGSVGLGEGVATAPQPLPATRPLRPSLLAVLRTWWRVWVVAGIFSGSAIEDLQDGRLRTLLPLADRHPTAWTTHRTIFRVYRLGCLKFKMTRSFYRGFVLTPDLG